jgi:hypothetical protein
MKGKGDMIKRAFQFGLAMAALGFLLFLWNVDAGAQCEGHAVHAAAVSDEEVISDEEVTADVPALHDLHEVVYELWHEAYPDKNYDMIKELLPRTDELTAKLDEAKLPGILRDKQAAWDAGKEKLKAALDALHAAAEADDQDAMLKETEAFHSAFEVLMRTIRPLVPALDAFHKELYKLYHYYAPDYDLEKIREAAAAMKEKIPPLEESKLRARLADRQEDFDAAVAKLSAAVDELVEIAKKDEKDTVLAAVEKVHTRYVKAEHIFD